MQPANIPLNAKDRDALQEITRLLRQANLALDRLSPEALKATQQIHNPTGTLPYCVKWGVRACEDLILQSSPREVPPIWVSHAELKTMLAPAIQALGLPLTTVDKLISQKKFVIWRRGKTPLYDLVECREVLKALQ